ncbi:MAG: hypothetical protein WBR24_01420 [Desulfobacterales bacterium]|jgi:hypothetical protein
MAFAAYPSSVFYKKPGQKLKRNAVQHLLWGDWLKLLGPVEGEWVKVRARGETGWMHRDDIQEDRLLEVNFVDIGQGDGCLLVTPEDKFIVINAGEGDNMYRFLHWRFGGFKERFTFESAVITHPDQDHYRGFEPLFEVANVHFGTVFHNGFAKRPPKEVGHRDQQTRKEYCGLWNDQPPHGWAKSGPGAEARTATIEGRQVGYSSARTRPRWMPAVRIHELIAPVEDWIKMGKFIWRLSSALLT